MLKILICQCCQFFCSYISGIFGYNDDKDDDDDDDDNDNDDDED